MSPTTYIVIRDLDKAECPWLGGVNIPAGSIVATTIDIYRCCSPSGVFISFNGVNCEVPADSVLEQEPEETAPKFLN